MQVQKTVKYLVPVLLITTAVLFGSILLLRLFYLAALLLAASFLWTKLSMRKLTSDTAKPPEHLQAGDIFRWKIEFLNKSRLPQVFLHCDYTTDLACEHETTVLNIAGRDSYTWEPRITCKRRGLFSLGPVTVTSNDPFGLFSRKVSLGGKKDLIIYPTTVELPYFKSSSFVDFGPRAGDMSLSSQGPDASSVRDFNSGDSLQHIHWPSTAKVGKLMVKSFDTDHSYNTAKKCWVLLDMHEESHHNDNEQSSDDFAITIAASVIKKSLGEGMRVGLLTASDNNHVIKPERGEQHQWQIFKTLALMKTGNSTSLNELALGNLPFLRDNPPVIIIVTSATRNLLETIHQLRNRTDIVVVIYLDISSWGGHSIPVNQSRAIKQLGAQIYLVRKGEELAKALDSKANFNRPLAIG